MPSQLRSPAPSNKPSLSTIQKKQKMSLTQTYYLAHTARAKLSKEAARADHDLRLLVGHANLLDGLMIDLAEAEREQESWFNQTVNGASAEEPKHIQWAENLQTVTEDYEEDSESDDSEDDSEDEIAYATAATIRVPSTTVTEVDMDSEEEEEDDEEEFEHLQLRRTPSRSSPPELLHESDSDSDDDSMPPSPPAPELRLDAFSEKQRQAALASEKSQASIPHASAEDSFYEEGFYLPQRQVAVY